MENKNSLLIRKYMNLMESINNKLITNEKMLNEDLFQAAALDAKIAANELEGYLKMMNKDAKIKAELIKSGINSSENLLVALKGNRLTGRLKGALELSILKSNTKNATLIDIATENLVRNERFNTKHASEFAKGQPAYEKALKLEGYSDDAITKIVQKKFNQINPKTGKPYDRPQTLKKGDVDISTNKPKKITDPTDSTKLTNPKDPTFWEKIKTIGWKKAALAAVAVGGTLLLWYWFKQNNIKDEDIPSEPPLDGEWAPCLKKILENKQGRVDKLTSGTLVVKVKNTTYPDGVLFFSNGKVLTNDGKRKGTWKCKEGKVTDIKEQSTTGNNIGSDVEKIVSYLKGNVINSGMLTNVKNILNTYNKSGQGKQLLSTYKRISGEFLENTLQSKTTLNDPSERKIRNEIYAIIRAVKGSGGTSTSDPLSGIEIIWDDKKKEEVTPIKKDLYRDCNDFPLTFGCKGPLVSELQICLKMTGVDGKLGPNTKATAEAWGSKNNIPFLVPLGDKEVFGVTEENFKKICLNKPNPEPVIITPPNVDGPIDNPTINPEEPAKPEERKKSDEELGWALYTKLKKAGLLYPRKGLLGGERIIYKGSDLSDENQRLLITYLNTKDYALTVENGEIKPGEKLVFKKIKRK
jgi:hypothetical protein